MKFPLLAVTRDFWNSFKGITKPPELELDAAAFYLGQLDESDLRDFSIRLAQKFQDPSLIHLSTYKSPLPQEAAILFEEFLERRGLKSDKLKSALKLSNHLVKAILASPASNDIAAALVDVWRVTLDDQTLILDSKVVPHEIKEIYKELETSHSLSFDQPEKSSFFGQKCRKSIRKLAENFLNKAK